MGRPLSYDVFLQAFRHGDAATTDGAAAFAILEPRISDRDEGWARVRTADGGADVYGIDDPSTGLMVNHAEGHRIWDVVHDLALAVGYAVMPVGCPTCVASDDVRKHLPTASLSQRSWSALVLRSVQRSSQLDLASDCLPSTTLERRQPRTLTPAGPLDRTTSRSRVGGDTGPCDLVQTQTRTAPSADTVRIHTSCCKSGR